MKKNIILFTIICVLLLSVNVVYSQKLNVDTETGNDVYRLYQSYKEVNRGKVNNDIVWAENLEYITYVKGMYNMMLYYEKETNAPKTFETKQICDIFGKYLENNPEERSFYSTDLFIESLKNVGWLKKGYEGSMFDD